MANDNKKNWTVWVKWTAIVLIALAVLRILAIVIEPFVDPFKDWIESLGFWGPIVLAGAYVVATVAFVPGSLLTLVAGAVFGLWIGFITVSIASTIGAALAFLIARHLARSRVEAAAEGRPKFKAIDTAIGEGGWKIVALLRLSPAFPFNLQNYFYGLTPIRFWPYVITSWIAMIPGTFLYVYLGHVAGQAVSGSGKRTIWEWLALIVGLAATAAVTVYITILARNQLKKQTIVKIESESENQEVAGPHVSGAVAAGTAAIILVSAAAYAHFNSDTLTEPLQKLADSWSDEGDAAPRGDQVAEKQDGE